MTYQLIPLCGETESYPLREYRSILAGAAAPKSPAAAVYGGKQTNCQTHKKHTIMLEGIYSFIQALIGMAVLAMCVIFFIAVFQHLFGKDDK